jgi:Polysaccharide lyase
MDVSCYAGFLSAESRRHRQRYRSGAERRATIASTTPTRRPLAPGEMRRSLTQLLIALGVIVGAASAGGSGGPNGTVIYGHDWEKGRLDTSQWGAQCDNLTPPYFGTRGTFRVQRKIVGQGRWAARFDLPPDPTKATACEIIHNRTLDLGRVDYYALAVFFPRRWREPGDQPSSFWGMVIAVFNYQRITGPPVGLFAHRHYVNLVVGSGYFDGYATRWYSGNGIARGNLPPMYAIPRPLKLGSWHQVIVRVRWSAGNDGAVDVWHRLQRKRRWKQTVRFRGKPTVQWTASMPAVSEMRTWDKLGGYRGVSSSPASVWHDAFCRAATFRAAQSCLS